jgi:hypothetical protein
MHFGMGHGLRRGEHGATPKVDSAKPVWRQ